MKKILVVVAPLALAACGGPVELTVAKLAGDLISYVTTGKSTTDHAVSAVAERDCALHRPLFEEDVCRDNVVLDDAVALAEPGAPSVKQKIRDAEPAIYAVNAPGEDWSNPKAGARTSAVIVQTDLPPRATSHAEATVVPQTAPVEIASAQAQFTPDHDRIPLRNEGPLDPQGEADAAVAGYVAPPKPVAPVAKTQTAALTDTGIMTDEVSVIAPENAGQDKLVAVPLPGDYVILASFADLLRAQNALSLYREYQPRLISATVAGREYLRVAVGPLSHQHAKDLRHLAAKKGVKDPWIVGIDAAGE
ncbi:SPOR domain-containing protein [Thalassospira sp. SN3W]|uniref:SPOR domain-containing protein n=1 Tax=Thalassospira sp. SN3W TaxID=3035476 RepID=UPI00311AD404